ncbi:MAG: VTT domain-containing protein [Candidatus Omnitrophota bacterium]
MKNRDKFKVVIKFLILLSIIILFWLSGRYFDIDTEAIQQSLQQFPIFYSGIIYIFLYVVISFFVWFSKDVFWFLGAVIFGAYLSALFIWIAEIINALILFYLARLLGRQFVERYLRGRYKAVDEKLSKINLFWLFILRAAPLIPYRFMDLAVGLTRIQFKKYFIAVVLASPIKIFWIQYVLAGVGKIVFKDSYALVEYFLNNKTLLMFSMVYVILVIMVIYKASRKD